MAHPFTFKGKKLPDAPSDELTCNILNLIGSGVHVDVACRACGITEELLGKWIAVARDDRTSVHAEFFRLCDIALAQDEARDIMLVGSGAKFSPALQWKLSRKSPQRWGDRIHQTVEIAGLLQSPDDEEQYIQHDDETRVKILAVLEAAGAFEDMRKNDPELADSVEISEEPIDVKKVNGSGKKRKK